MKIRFLALLAILAAAAVWAAPTPTPTSPDSKSAPMRIELPAETEVFPTGAGSDLANAFCLTCHSADYIATQPPLERAGWKAIVGKMSAKFGAPIPETAVEPIVDYLEKTFGPAQSG